MATASYLRKKQAEAAAVSAEGALRRGKAAERQAGVAEKKLIPDIVASAAGGAGAMAKGIGSIIAATNDPSWYKRLGITDQTARLPENPGPGSAVLNNFLDHKNETTIPAVHVSYFIPTIGKAVGNPSDPANYAAANFMAQLRKYNSRAGSDYDPGDLMQLQVFTSAVGSVLEDIRFCIGAYNKFSGTHKNIARMLVAAKGYNFGELQNNRATIITRFNECVNRLNYIPMVKDLPVRQRWEFLSKLCIRDARTSKGAFYMFANQMIPAYDIEEGVISFETHTYGILATLNSLLAAICNVTDSAGMVVMLSDLKGGIKDSSLYIMPYVFEDYCIDFQESREVIDQIHNLVTLPTPDLYVRTVSASGSTTDDFYTSLDPTTFRWLSLVTYSGSYNNIDIYQNASGYLMQGGKLDGITGLHFFYSYDGVNSGPKGSVPFNDKHLKETMLDYDSDNVSTDEIIVGSRLTSLWEHKTFTHNWDGYAQQTAGAWVPTQYGTEIVLYNLIFCCDPDTANTLHCYVSTTQTNVLDANTINDAQAIGIGRRESLTLRETLHWRPKYYFIGVAPSTTAKCDSLMWDVGNLINYTDVAAENLNYMCVLSEFSFEDSIFKPIR